MKVLMMHRNDGLSGGAQIQMNRLRAGLRAHGVDARLLCRESESGDAAVMPRRPVLERPLGAIARRIGLNDIHLVSSSGVADLPEVEAADVIDIHCMHSGTFSYLSLPSLAARKPLVFTFHDMWPVTGHCHASLECARWRTGCGSCPHPEVEPAIARDATALEWRLKRRAYRRSEFTIAAPSRWMIDRISESMLAGRDARLIPHGLDLEVFAPRDRGWCREALGLPADATVILCAMEYMERPLKGAALMVEAMESIPAGERAGCILLCFGRADRALLRRVPLPVVDLGYLGHDQLKAIAYRAADFLVNPSLAEAFGLVPLEAMACGVPVAAFGVGGVPEMVRHLETGLIAPAGDVPALADGIRRLIRDIPFRRAAGEASRRFVESNHDLRAQVRATKDLYAELMERKRRPSRNPHDTFR